MEFRHAGLRRFWERDDASGLNPDYVNRISRILTALLEAHSPAEMDLPGYPGCTSCPGTVGGVWSVRVSGNWRITFRFADGEAVDINFEDYH